MRDSRQHIPDNITGSTILILLFLLALLLYRIVTGAGEPLIPDTPGGILATENGSRWFNLYFTHPASDSAFAYAGEPDEALVAAVNGARLSVDVAAYSFNLNRLADALVNAHRRGVSVRMVVESDNLDEPLLQELMGAGISVIGDRREGLMHNKFAIVDQQEVWSGSMNLTFTGAFRDDNHLIRIRSEQLAEAYTVEFEEMFARNQFGPGSPANTLYPSVTVDGTLVELYFSPDDGVAAHILEQVGAAKESIHFLAFSFTADDIANLMIQRARDGVQVAGVIETSQYLSNQGNEYMRLRESGVDVRLDGNSDQMHHKVIVIDGQTVITGSYNFSASAETHNDENLLIIQSEELAAMFMEEFQRIYAEAQP